VSNNEIRIGPSERKSWPAGYVLALIGACFEAGLSQDESSKRVKAACHANVTVNQFREALGLAPDFDVSSNCRP
jgi:hypothetical protein